MVARICLSFASLIKGLLAWELLPEKLPDCARAETVPRFFPTLVAIYFDVLEKRNCKPPEKSDSRAQRRKLSPISTEL
jgi:hypothetical protein